MIAMGWETWHTKFDVFIINRQTIDGKCHSMTTGDVMCSNLLQINAMQWTNISAPIHFIALSHLNFDSMMTNDLTDTPRMDCN